MKCLEKDRRQRYETAIGLATSATARAGLILVWQTGTTNLVQELVHPDLSQGQIRALKFSPDGTEVACSPDGWRLLTGAMGHEAVNIWDLATRRELVRLRGEDHGFYYLEFSPDGQWLASRNWSPGQLHLWRAPSWEEIAAAETAEQEASLTP